jgi:hypothetical protein
VPVREAHTVAHNCTSSDPVGRNVRAGTYVWGECGSIDRCHMSAAHVAIERDESMRTMAHNALPHGACGILLYLRVRREDDQTVHDGLADQHAIEGIPVERRQP